jgi:hypothetical protein
MNINPLALALALEITRRMEANPEATLEEMMRTLTEEKPNLDLDPRIATQLNDMLGISTVPPDRIRIALLVMMPEHRGMLFVRKEMEVTCARLLVESPLKALASVLAKEIDAAWPRFRSDLDRIAVPAADPQILDQGGAPIERHHRAASGPTRLDVEGFIDV